ESALHHGQVNFLKGGIALADALSTVSPTYAREICTPEFGCGLDGLLRRREYELTGILNGVDYGEWNTTRNPSLVASYDSNHLEGKWTNKAALQTELGLPVDGSIPLFADVTRLADQKGVDLLHDAVLDLLGSGDRFQLALLGSGDPRLEAAIDRLARTVPNAVAARIGFDPALAHRIEAGADFFVMPSRFEPCGLNQLYSLRYGTIPIVRATGGLADSIIDPRENPEGATGIKFHEPTPQALAIAMRKGVSLFQHPEVLAAFRRRGMRTDVSWTRQATEYLDLYDEIYHGV
ncbi:MAG: glycogen synthase, partial [Verrucomicrobiota bacterium]